MATNYVRYVDVDADAGGNGTTTGLTGANCAFKSLSLAEAAGGGAGQPPANLTTNSDTYTIKCRSAHANHTADTSAVGVAGWTTNATSYVTITADDDHHHVGVWDDTKYRLTPSNAGAGAIIHISAYTRYGKLQIKNTNTADYSSGVADSGGAGGGKGFFDRLLVVTPSAANVSTSYLWSRETDFTNCIFICNATSSTSSAFEVGGYTRNFYHCTVVGTCRYIFKRSSGTVTVKNSYAGTTYGGGSCFSGTITQVTNASSDETATGTGLDNIAYDATNFTNVSAGSEDLRLPLGSALIGVGTDLSGESSPLNCPVDISGNSRPQGAAWDVGAHEYTATASGPANVKTALGLTKASVKTMNGLAIASVKTACGLN